MPEFQCWQLRLLEVFESIFLHFRRDQNSSGNFQDCWIIRKLRDSHRQRIRISAVSDASKIENYSQQTPSAGVFVRATAFQSFHKKNPSWRKTSAFRQTFVTLMECALLEFPFLYLSAVTNLFPRAETQMQKLQMSRSFIIQSQKILHVSPNTCMCQLGEFILICFESIFIIKVEAFKFELHVGVWGLKIMLGWS